MLCRPQLSPASFYQEPTPTGMFHHGLSLAYAYKGRTMEGHQLVFAKEVNVGSLEGGIKNKTERSP